MQQSEVMEKRQDEVPEVTVQTKAKGQGSANYGRVEELVNQNDDAYKHPVLPFPLFPPEIEAKWTANGPPAFGTEMLKWFNLREGTVFLNHGSYGAMPKPVKEIYKKWLDYVEEQPCQWFNNELFPLVIYATRSLARFIGAHPREVVFARNATTAINAILRSFPFKSGDALLCMNFTYGSPISPVYQCKFTKEETGAIKKTLQYVLPKQKVDIIDMQIGYPPTGKQVLDKLKEALEHDTEKKIRLVLLDHIISPLGLVLPMKELVDLSHAHGARVLVDGAHVVGQIPLNLRELDADYFVSNCHKWLYAPRGCAFAWVKQAYQNEVRPAVVSHGYEQGFQAEFIWQATDDYTPFLAVVTALKFVELCGAEKIMKYNHDLASWAAEMLAKEWKTEVIVPSEDFAALGLIRMPKSSVFAADGEGADALSQLLWQEFKIEAMIFPLAEQGLVVRIASQIYLEKEDFTKFANAILKLIQEGRY